jgi:membrane associated rhomboid family serine protease
MVIPLRDANPTRRLPVVTLILIALNFIFFLREPLRADECRQRAFFMRYAAIPHEVTTGKPLPRVFQDVAGVPTPSGNLLCQVGSPAYHKNVYLSVLFAMFLHAGWLHLLGSMLYLWIFGNNIEDSLGRAKFLLLYLVCGALATLVFAAGFGNSTETMVGASGAIAGVLAAYLVLFPRARILCLVPIFFFFIAELPAWVVLGLWFALQAVSSAGSLHGGGVAYLAHVGGFVAGLLLVLLLRPRRPRPIEPWA